MLTRVGAGVVFVALGSTSIAHGEIAKSVIVPSSLEPTKEDESTDLIVPGYLYSATGGTVSARGHGIEVSAIHVFDPRNYFVLGIVGQLQSYDGTHLRGALAAEGAFGPLGLELGWALRGSDGDHAAQHGIHFAPYFSLGIVSFAWRLTIPVGGSDRAYGFEQGFVFSLKLPVPIQNAKGLMHLMPALPVTNRGRTLRDNHGDSVLPTAEEHRRVFRQQFDSARWIADAQMEHASVESFLWLADDLDALKAPEDLVIRAVQAAEEERRHTQFCLSNAGPHVSLRSRQHRQRRVRPSVQRLCREAYVDGVVGEGRAAIVAAQESSRTTDPHQSLGLMALAQEEASHARLSADIYTWLASRHGAGLRFGDVVDL